MTNHNKRKEHNENQWEHEENARNHAAPARENACDQVAIGFGFASDWLRKWHEFFNQS